MKTIKLTTFINGRQSIEHNYELTNAEAKRVEALLELMDELKRESLAKLDKHLVELVKRIKK